MESKLLSCLEELLIETGYKTSETSLPKESPKDYAGKLSKHIAFNFDLAPFGQGIQGIPRKRIIEFSQTSDQLLEAYKEAITSRRIDLFYTVLMATCIPPSDKIFEDFLSNMIKDNDVENLKRLWYIDELNSRIFSKNSINPALKRRLTTLLYKEFISEGAISEIEDLMSRTKKRPAFDLAQVKALYPKIDAGSIATLFFITGLKPKKADVWRAYDYMLDNESMDTLSKFKKLAKIGRYTNNKKIQDCYRRLLSRGDLNIDFYKIKLLKDISGVAPEPMLTTDLFNELYSKNRWQVMETLIKSTGVKPALDPEELKYRLVQLEGRYFSSFELDSKIRTILKILGENLNEDEMQTIYKRLIKSRLSEGLKKIEVLSRESEITPKFDADFLQKEYALYLKQGWFTSIPLLEKITGIQPLFNGLDLRRIFFRTIDKDLSEDLKEVTNFLKLTGYKPESSDVQDEYVRLLNDQYFSSINRLKEVLNIKPEFTREEIMAAIEKELLFRDSNISEIIECSGYELNRIDAEHILRGVGVDSTAMDKIDNSVVTLILDSISDRRLSVSRLNKLLRTQKQPTKILYTKERASENSDMDFGHKFGSLLISLVSRKPENLERAYKMFGKDDLDYIRSRIDRKKVYYNVIHPRLDLLMNGEVSACENAFNEIHAKYFLRERTDVLSDLVEIIRGSDKPINKITVRTWERGIEDIFDNGKVQACVFYPNGGRAGEPGDVLDYIENQNVELIDMYFNGEKLKVATAICYKTKDECGNKVLLVDSVEAGKNVVAIGRRRWIDIMMNAIRNYSKENDFDYIFVNDSVTEGKATDFKNRVKSGKLTNNKLFFDGSYVYLEAFNPSKAGYYSAKGFLLNLKEGVKMKTMLQRGASKEDKSMDEALIDHHFEDEE